MTSEPARVQPVGVVVADDHPMFRAGVAAVVESLPWATVLALVADGEQAVEQSLLLRPDVLLVDLHMPGLSGMDVISRLSTDLPDTACLVLTMVESQEAAAAALRAGARGYLLKGASRTDIVRALEAVAHGEVHLGAGVGSGLLSRLAGSGDGLLPLSHLTARQRDVLEQMARGLSNADIARALHLSEKTVRNIVSAVLAALPASSRSEAIARARDAGLGAAELPS